jgi:methylase of polypeptide subunit release factors
VLEEYEKRGRRYTVIEALVVEEDGLEILRRRTHGLLVKREEG